MERKGIVLTVLYARRHILWSRYLWIGLRAIRPVVCRHNHGVHSGVCSKYNRLPAVCSTLLNLLWSAPRFVFYFTVFFYFTLDAGLLTRSQYSEGPATGHLDTGFSWFPCVYKQMLRWFPRFQVATTCFSCSPPDLNLVVTNFMFCIHVT